ncbi:MAG: aldo/keto reductase [Bacillota bacterium]|nr:aldo/keto reductase [Bacillota bacterium]
MNYITLPNTDLKVSKVCLGCMGFGDAQKGMHKWTLDYDHTKEIIEQALKAGINFFDTAMGYQMGTSEEYLGRAIQELSARENVIIATKFVPRSLEQIEQGIGAKEHIFSCLENSLKRLKTDYIDLYYLHMWDKETPIEETLEALNECVKCGKVRYIAISNCFAWQLAKANEIAKANGWAPFVAVQGHYNLIFREEEREMAPYCNEHGISMIPYSALAAGRLARKIGETSSRLEKDAFAKGKYDATEDLDNQVIERVYELSVKKQVSMTAISLAWLMTKVASPVVGATKPHHLEGIVEAMDVELSKEELVYLEELYQPHKLVGVMVNQKGSR